MATNYVTADYTEVIDLQTVADKTSIIGIHTPVGVSPYTKLSGFFDQFRKYKYNGIKSLVMVPSAGLPIDPLGVTRMTGTSGTMDPRDTFNPIITHGAHGESLSSTLDRIYTSRAWVNASGNPAKDTGSSGNVSGQSASADEFRVSNIIDTVYYQKLTDTSWKKWGIQSGVKMRNLYPLVHKLALNRPVLPVVDTASLGVHQTNRGEFMPITTGSNTTQSPDSNGTMGSMAAGIISLPTSMTPAAGSDRSYLQEFTNGMTRLGWLPTAETSQNSGDMQIAALPKLMMMCMVLPPAYSCEQFFRLVIKHSFSFADFTSSLGLKTKDHSSLTSRGYENWIDYQSSSKDGEKEVLELEVNEGTTIDVINGSTDLVSDGVS